MVMAFTLSNQVAQCSLLVTTKPDYRAKVFFESGWALLRPSDTQPVIRMFVEARTEAELERLKAEFTAEFTAEFQRAKAAVGG